MPLQVVNLPLLNQKAEREMIKKFRHEHTWLSEVMSKNSWVNNDVIKIPVQGAAPSVLINNNVYPIVSSQREDGYVALSLNKYDTTNTDVTDDELYALPYEKVSDVQVQHREELEEKTGEHALHSIAPDENTAETPVLEATGPTRDGRKTLVTKDLIRYKELLDNKKIPKRGRIMVLSPSHVADLLEEDTTFSRRYQNYGTGAIMENFYGFKTYETVYSPEFSVDGLKLPFDTTETGLLSSVVFHKRSVAKGRGTVTRYARDAKTDPEYRKTTIGFRLWFIAVAFRSEGIGALVSENV
ncbi:hypothetical protein LS482_16170 [Sinomicrobium kalidii]|uniref:hypothetical protein n=1 Tax=Sinomicrobium kalidii TaxID=2900738 RepID=UPI001E28D7C0|nr:hypothetical protein [Sinomicrobium kalidii]UGU15209.1 hypothetical protein LS482_16170 [Sinomicrobium kalidii]